MSLDTFHMRNLLQTLAEETFEFWNARKKFGDGRPYGVINLYDGPITFEVNMFGLSNVEVSNHETLALQTFNTRQKDKVREIWSMITQQAECLDVHGFSISFELFNMGKMAARGEAPYPDAPQIALSFMGIGITTDDTASTPRSSDELAKRLGEITHALKDAPACCDRIFEIEDAHIPAEDAETALLVYASLLGFDLEACAKTGFPDQISVKEILETDDLLKRVMARKEALA